MNNTITYKGYRIYLRRDSQTKRVNGATILIFNQFHKTLTAAKRVIDIVEGE